MEFYKCFFIFALFLLLPVYPSFIIIISISRHWVSALKVVLMRSFNSL